MYQCTNSKLDWSNTSTNESLLCRTMKQLLQLKVPSIDEHFDSGYREWDLGNDWHSTHSDFGSKSSEGEQLFHDLDC